MNHAAGSNRPCGKASEVTDISSHVDSHSPRVQRSQDGPRRQRLVILVEVLRQELARNLENEITHADLDRIVSLRERGEDRLPGPFGDGAIARKALGARDLQPTLDSRQPLMRAGTHLSGHHTRPPMTLAPTRRAEATTLAASRGAPLSGTEHLTPR